MNTNYQNKSPKRNLIVLLNKVEIPKSSSQYTVLDVHKNKTTFLPAKQNQNRHPAYDGIPFKVPIASFLIKNEQENSKNVVSNGAAHKTMPSNLSEPSTQRLKILQKKHC